MPALKIEQKRQSKEALILCISDPCFDSTVCIAL